VRGRWTEKRKKSLFIQLLEYGAARVVLFAARITPLAVIHAMSRGLGTLLYLLARKRRTIATDNLRHAFGGQMPESRIRSVARKSCASFFLTFLEAAKFRYLFDDPRALEALRSSSPGLNELFRKARGIHDESGGCLFITPHIGNWELLPHVSAMLGIPLVVVARPLDNKYLERLIFADRTRSGQLIIPKKNALFVLQKTLQQGKSIGMLADQSTMRGISVDFFTRKATTTPVPAMLAVMYQRPLVVVACLRSENGRGFEGFVSDPIWPGSFKSEKEEIFRLTETMNKKMEEVIRMYPAQYLWMHNRWKTYAGKKEILL